MTDGGEVPNVPTDRRVLTDPELDRQLKDVGFVVVSLLQPHEARRVLDAVQGLEPADGFAPDGSGDNLSSYHCTFLDASEAYKAAADQLIRATFSDRLGTYLDRFHILTGNLYVKPPGTGIFEVHQNWPTTVDVAQTTVTAWCPLIDTSKRNGTIEVVPKSHKIVPDIASVTAPKYFEPFYDELISHWLEPVDLRAGECIIFDDSLLHWSAGNESNAPRWAVQIELIPDEVEPIMPLFDHDAGRFEFYAVDEEWFVTHGITNLREREGLRLVATIDHRNELLDEEQFAELMASSDEIRDRLARHGSPHEIRWVQSPSR
jgi:ectoine hydroxylase-related dioxygenase (phytanoyl-CoA dioxygenase family)